MRKAEEYLRHAEECEALARKAVSAEQREQIIQMAETWRMLAEQHLAKEQKRDDDPD